MEGGREVDIHVGQVGRNAMERGRVHAHAVAQYEKDIPV